MGRRGGERGDPVLIMDTAIWSDPWANRDAVEAHVRSALEKARGGVRRRNYGKGHGYEVRVGTKWEKVPGVTTVLKTLDKSRPLMIWAARLERAASVRAAYEAYRREGFDEGLTFEEFEDVFARHADAKQEHVKALEEAGNIGTGLHALIEWRVNQMLGVEAGEEPVVPDASAFLFPVWEEWARSVDFRPVLSEFPVYGCAGGPLYAGTVDIVAWVSGELVLGDWKTSNGFHAEMELQNAAYRMACEQMGLFPRGEVGGLLVRIPKVETDEYPFETLRIEGDGAEENARRTVFANLLAIRPWVEEQDRRSLEEWKRRRRARAA